MVNSVHRAAEILNILSLGNNRIKDICKELSLSKSTTHRLLKTLEDCGFVVQDPISHQYYLGYLITKLSSNPTTAHQNLVVCAFEEMNRLREISRETVTIQIRIGTQRICLEEMEADHKILFRVGRGSVSPIYAGSAGKVLLAELSADERKTLISNIQLLPIGPNTITDREILFKELEKVKQQGYAIGSGELVEGAMSISVPIKGYICPVALSVFGPKFRLGEKIMDLKDHMVQSARRIQDKIRIT